RRKPDIRDGAVVSKWFDNPRRPTARFRCLLATHCLDAGGIDEFVAFLARRLPAKEIEATVMLTDRAAWGGRLAKDLREEGVRVIEALPEDSCRWMADNRPDVISAHAPPDWF